jgi:hypothetical protein
MEILRNKDYPEELIQITQEMCEDTNINNDKGAMVSSREEIINQDVKQGCHLSRCLLEACMLTQLPRNGNAVKGNI